MIFGWKPLGEPLGETPRLPAVKVEDRTLRHVVADALPVERGLAAHMQSFEASLQQRDTRMQGGCIVGAAVDPARQPLKPARPELVDGEICRYPEGGEILGGQRRPRCQMGIELV